MISVVAELKKQPDNRLKRIKLAFGINGAILLHRPAYTPQNWIYQLIDFFNVADFPIEAYEPFALVSEIQGHMWNLAIEYRPKYFPYRAFVDIGYCSLSSNIIYPMTGCTLRVLTEDCIFSLGPVVKSKSVFNESIDCEGLVPVLNAGLLNISIRLNDHSKMYPNIDLRSSIHDVHLKTCYDSADALAQLIAYIANDKDLMPMDKNIDQKKNDSHVTKSVHNNNETMEHINKLMADAVKDVEVNPALRASNKTEETTKLLPNKSETTHSTPCSCYNSLDECNFVDFETKELLTTCHQDEFENSLPQIEAELGATSNKPVPTLEDKDFHVIDDDEIFFMDKFGVDQVFVSEDPLRIVDNHFCLPSEKTDLLRPPVHFPISEESYTLCEMTFTWHLFGGKDFPHIGEKSKTKGNSSLSTGTGMSETYKHGVSQAPNESHKNFKKIIPDGSKVSQRLVMGLAQLQGSGISLREVINRRGLLGWNKLFEFLCKEWIKDIKRNQLPNILSGIGPTNAVLQLFQGFFDLFRLPLRQYNKDGRIIRGFQLGAQSFSARTAFAALEITSRIIHLLQFTAETTFDMLSAGPSLNRRRKTKIGKKRQGRPKDLREGVANAYTIVKEGINDSANTLLEAAVVEHDQKGYSGAVGAVVRQIPQLVVCPAVLATQATTNILGGAKSSLVPEAKREARNKWKHEKN
ncbi:hypothetical protein ACLKA7_007845 [Drosophila subpalustris]